MKKKIAKLTWLHNGNYGSVLQAFALQLFLKDNGYDVTDLDYKASLKTKLINWCMNHNSPKLFLGKFVETKRKKSYSHPEKFELRAKKFSEFKKNNMRLSPLYRSPKEIKEVSDEYDIFICGSDQIWSPALMNPVFYLSFLPKEKIRIAYAPSFGVINTTNGKKRQISGYLKNFNYLSVRETQGQALVEELIGKSVPIQVDPTMLINRERWNEYTGKPIFRQPYVFCYLLTPNPVYIESVKQFADEKGLRVVIVPTSKGPFDTGFEEVVDAGPAEWLNLLRNASFVCTDSFHGCIFSAIFHRDFILYKRFADGAKNSENSRVYTLTKLLKIEKRLIDVENMKSFNDLEPIDFDVIDEIIQREAVKSGEWLLHVLEESCKQEK